MILKKLQNAGLGEREAKVYLALLELGEANIANLVKKSKIKRSTIYDMLELLKQKGLVSQTNLKKRTLYYAESPKKIITELENRKKGVEEIMPELLSITNLLSRKPKIRYFEGKEAVKDIFEDTLEYQNSEVLTFLPYPYLDLDKDYFWKYYNPERVKKKIWMRILAPDTKTNQKAAQEMSDFLVTTKLMDNQAFSDFDVEIKIYGKTKIGIISHQENLGIIIESKKIFDGLKAIFEYLWIINKD